MFQVPVAPMASVIANEFSEATGDLYLSALIEIGLALFLTQMAPARLRSIRSDTDNPEFCKIWPSEISDSAVAGIGSYTLDAELAGAVEEHAGAVLDVRRQLRHADVAQQLEAGGHSSEVLVGERDLLEAILQPSQQLHDVVPARFVQ